MSKNSKKFLVIGLGSMGTRRVKHCLEQKHSVIGYDLRYDRTKKARDELKIQTVENFLDIEKLVELKEIDGIFIDTPPAEHFRYIQYCLDKHINFFVEQPIVHTTTLLELCKNYLNTMNGSAVQQVMQVSANLRHSKMVKKLQELFTSADVSNPLYVFVECAEYLPDWHPYEPYTDYYPSHKDMGGGLDVICDVDWLNYLFGNFQLKNKTVSKKSSLKIDTPDIMQYTFLFDGADYRNGGPLVTIYEDFLQRTPIHTAKFITENEVIYADFIHNNITIDRGKLREISIINLKEEDFTQLCLNSRGWNWIEETYYLETLEFLGRVDKNDTSLKSFKTEIYKLSQIL